ncbi:hypothetical protein HMPREF3232_00920 [Fannyhessea vaginae]|nr:hypothetical protein HMPREF3232_00920 [Fannyhessea vaginae]
MYKHLYQLKISLHEDTCGGIQQLRIWTCIACRWFPRATTNQTIFLSEKK